MKAVSMNSKRGWWIAIIGVLGALVFSATASAHTGEFAKFNDCPSTTSGVQKCLHSITTGGSIVLGKKTTPIVNPVTLQGGISAPNAEHISTFYGATDGNTLSKTPQPVPGGLLGIVPPESSPPLVKALSAFFFENGLTGVNATLELAKPASEIRVSEYNLILEEGLALKLPVRVHLENPFLGGSCYVGSSTSPLIWNLTSGETSPPPPNKPIHGSSGLINLKEEGRIVTLEGASLVDNAWSAPEATGCGGIISFLVDPVIDSMLGLPSAAGNNSATLTNTIDVATAVAVNNH
jgi:hypothetical protein